MKNRILAVDDEEDIVELVRYNLEREGYETLSAFSGKEALEIISKKRPDLIVLDLMLPDLDGLEITRRLKRDEELKDIPIVMLTAKGEEADVVVGLELGADDYIVKPFSPRILVARVRSVLRRRESGTLADIRSESIRIHDIEIHMGRHQVYLAGDPIDLTFSEFEILAFLSRRPGWVFTRSQIVDAIRGDNYPVTERSVDVQVVGLRRKLGVQGDYIETVRGVGYRFKEL
ncbi:response regulator [Desulforegula conservatrix]|uniref:response regulator n=1 Tax=Desulforegula conservatrix TaxID=153026 RepID=UPI00041FF091|nr:response regulator [Desulforegula conservatrix]